MKLNSLILILCSVFSTSLQAQQYMNYADGKPAKSSLKGNTLSLLTDGDLAKGWVCSEVGKEVWVEVDLTAEFEVGGIHIHFYEENFTPLQNFSLQYKRGAEWFDLADAGVTNNFNMRFSQTFKTPVSASAIRLKTNNKASFGITEIQVWGTAVPAIPFGVKEAAQQSFSDDKYWVSVNQIAYNLGAPKRFTVPNAATTLKFEIIDKESGKSVFKGNVINSIGDFTVFNPKVLERKEYYIKVKGGKLKDGQSFPFAIGKNALQEMCYKPADYFMSDARSVIGTHNSAYGGTPWRDGAYYTFEIPSMVMLYLSNREVFNHMKPNNNWKSDREKVLQENFKLVSAQVDRDALLTVQNYYELLPKPKRDDVPDIIQNIRFGVGWLILDPISVDPSGDPLGERLHNQTVEQLAYFLYGYPAMKQFIEDDFYKLVLDRTLRWWGKVGLFEVIKDIGDGKGRHVPGHSIMPNLMMYEVARREGLSDADKFMQAAIKQTEWVIETLDWTNPMHTKGQRISEHKMITALVHFYMNYPEQAPAGLKEKLISLSKDIISKSTNMWDFRRFDLADNWTLPGYNETGNVAGFPACAFALSLLLEQEGEREIKDRMVQLGYAHFDNLFGRNPKNAHAANHGDQGFEGVDNEWPFRYYDDVTARLEMTRGSLSSLPGTEMYPFNPNGKPRHPEGWTVYNANWNVSLAFLNFYEEVSSFDILKDCLK